MKTFARRERRAHDIAASISSSQGWGSGGSSQGTACSDPFGAQPSDPYSFPVDGPEAIQAECQPVSQARTTSWSQRSGKPTTDGNRLEPSRLSGTSRRVCFAPQQPADKLKQPLTGLKRQNRAPANGKQLKRRKRMPGDPAAASKSPSQLPCHTNATTVLEAQESGAHAQMVDDALYALDGLVPGVGQQALADSAACLASIAVTRRGLLALKSEDIIDRCFLAAKELPIKEHPNLALCCATLILACSMHDAAALAHPAALSILKRLLDGDCNPAEGIPATSKAHSRLTALLTGSGPMGRAAPPAPHTLHPPAILLTALSSALHPARASGNVEDLKTGLCDHGVLQVVACLALQHGSALLAAYPDARQLYILCACLTVLENASSASPSTVEHLIGIRLKAAVEPEAGFCLSAERNEHDAASTPAMLVHSISSLAASYVVPSLQSHAEKAGQPTSGAAVLLDSQGTSSSTRELNEWGSARCGPRSQLQSDCLHAALSALMNLTHNHETGCCMTAEAGGLTAVAGLLTDLAHAQPSPLAPPSGQPCHTLPMTGKQLVDSQTSTSGAAFSSADELPSVRLPEADSSDCQVPSGALPAQSPASAALENLLREADLVSVALGLLINLAEASHSSCSMPLFNVLRPQAQQARQFVMM
ncbi:hypothetical protein WJX84_005908 [Apatococcus fuscideae]|uniref:Wings apart-like protein C-terminal domain-containing protein n=2 Tax=Apatococcus fuscideae TaxID=2026836 RepID=A0AAW1T6X1_9CHLO